MKTAPVLILILITSIYLRSYTVSAGLPYFYDEDEAHHFNRTANMAKSGDMNPHYFHKPSLHFYLRIPVIWLSSYLAERNGHFEEMNEIRTYNKYGIAGYAFTASHPGIVKWNRSLSLSWGIIIILLTYLIARIATASEFCALLSAASTAICPPLITYASVIGVDILMTMMCMLTVYFSLKYSQSRKSSDLIMACIFSGLAVSSKYNALPVCVVPLISLFLNKDLSRKNLVCGIGLPVISFFAASPFILTSLPAFIEDLSYEVWHYSTAGHVGHSASPGLEQIIFYSNWFYTQALGPVFTIFSLIGLLHFSIRKKKTDVVFLSLPVLYFLMMIAQKANFVRNMLVVLPFLMIFANFAIFKAVNYLGIKYSKTKFLTFIIFALSAIQPFNTYLSDKKTIITRAESRKDVTEWILNKQSIKETAISGSLQLIPQIPITLKNYTTFDEKTISPIKLWLDGFDRVIVSPAQTDSFKRKDILVVEKIFPGNEEPTRIIENPKVEVLGFDSSKITAKELLKEITSCQVCNITCVQSETGYDCGNSASENLTWTQKRVTAIELPGISENLKDKDEINLTISLAGPWENKIGVFESPQSYVAIPAQSNWAKVSLKLKREQLHDDRVLLYTEVIKSPFKQKMSADKRKLGVALGKIELSAR